MGVEQNLPVRPRLRCGSAEIVMIITVITIIQLWNLASALTHRAMDNRGNGSSFKETPAIQSYNQEGLHAEQTLVCKGKKKE